MCAALVMLFGHNSARGQMPHEVSHFDSGLGNGTGLSMAQPIQLPPVAGQTAVRLRGNIRGYSDPNAATFINDLVVGEGFDDGRLNDKPNTGAVLIISGADGSLIRELHSIEAASRDAFGYSICFLGNITHVDGPNGAPQGGTDQPDFDGLYRDEIAIGAPLFDRVFATGGLPVLNSGAVYIYDGYQLATSSDQTPSAPPVAPIGMLYAPEGVGTLPGWQFGFSLAYAGDAVPSPNPASVPIGELIIGAPGATGVPGTAGGTGRAYVYSLFYDPQFPNLTFSRVTTFSGTTSGENFGFAVAGNGDLGGPDVVPDILVGVPRAVLPGPGGAMIACGEVRVFDGRDQTNTQILPAFAPTVIGPTTVGARYGHAIGFPIPESNPGPGGRRMSLAIGSPYTRTFPCMGSMIGPAPGGIVDVWQRPTAGGPWARFNTYALGGGSVNDEFGFALSVTPSINPPTGQLDLIVGAPSSSVGLPEGGSVRVLDVHLAPLSSVRASAEGAASFDHFGYSLVALGDWAPVGSDGVPDFAVGAPFADPRVIREAGRVDIRSGALSTVPIVAQYNGTLSGRFFGEVVASGRDIYAGPPPDSGIDDLLLAMPSADIAPSQDTDECATGDADDETTAPDTGRVFVVSGRTGTRTIVATLDSPDIGARFGEAVLFQTYFSDLSPDVIVGAPLAFGAGGARQGSVFLYSGQSILAGGPVRPYRRIDSPEPAMTTSERFGQSIASVGDWNGDGTDELAISAPGANVIHVYDGASLSTPGLPGTEVRLFEIRPQGLNSNTYFGWSIANGRDLTSAVPGAELIVGAPETNRMILPAPASIVSVGSGYVEIYGATTPLPTVITAPLIPRLLPLNATFGGGLGVSVSGPGDVNGDSVGAGDVIAGMPFDTVGSLLQAGSVMVFADLFTSPQAIRIPSPDPTNSGLKTWFGRAVSSGGLISDCTQPGDFLVGAPGADPASVVDAGSTFVYRLSPPPTTFSLVTRVDCPNDPTIGVSTGAGFGASLAGPITVDATTCRSESLISSPGFALIDSMSFRLRTVSSPQSFGFNRVFPKLGRTWVFGY